MKLLSLLKYMSVSLCVGVIATGCATSTSSSVDSAVACDGKPNWCLVIANEIKVDAGLFVDGQKVALVGAEQTARVPVPAGEVHQVNYCKYFNDGYLFGLIPQTKMKCRGPETVKFEQNHTIVIYDAANFGY